MKIEAPHRVKAAKKSMQVEGFEVSAWKDGDGLIRMEIRNANGQEVFHGLNLPWESLAGSGRVVFTSNPYIIESVCPVDSDDGRESPRFLRDAGKDSVFRAWFMKSNVSRNISPEQVATSIETTRRREGRDPETGALLTAVSEKS